ncbi:MAG TPA: Tm-1-like ATP-binding domain-containing protein, partial [bacterium]|nr:Tm-1-like ATP-binding domain-containing protein [bacterium]
NRVTRPILVRAAGMLVGMIEAAPPSGTAGDAARAPAAVAVTALGNTHAAVTRVMADLGARGYEVVPFHASGAGGSAMEWLVRQGEFAAVIDLTPHEFLGEVLGDDIYTPVHPGRLTAAGAAGIPQVVAPGGLDYFVFGAEETVPPRYRGRPTHHHNPYNTNVRASADELHRVGKALAERLNNARGPVAFLVPLRGWSHIGREGGPLWDPQANEALREVMRRTLRTGLRYIEVDAAINDPSFADEVAAVACEFLGPGNGAARPRERAEGGVQCS